MRIRALLHMEHEGLGLIRAWIAERGHVLEATRVWEGGSLGDPASFDLLIVMGGAMNVDEEEAYPWLSAEKALIARAIASGVPVLGICLGAQLIARVLGAPVAPMGLKEIGWFPVHAEAASEGLFPSLAPGASFGVAHWHGDAFSLPDGCDRLFSSAGCREQGFVLRGRPVVGLQFHLELDGETLRAFIDHGKEELAEGGDWIQRPSDMLALRASQGPFARRMLEGLLDALMDGPSGNSAPGNARP